MCNFIHGARPSSKPGSDQTLKTLEWYTHKKTKYLKQVPEHLGKFIQNGKGF